MKKRFYQCMKETIFVIVLLCLWQVAGAQTTKKVVPAFPLTLADTCMSFDGSTQSKTFELNNMTGVFGLSWSVLGDLEIVSTTSTTVTVRSRKRENPIIVADEGYGKGRVVATFTDTLIDASCGPQTAYIDVNKVFQPDDLNDVHIIVGPECIAEDEIVTFSINSRFLSVNLDQNIGQDLYKWTLPHTLSPTNLTTVDGWELLYFSSDSSSVTFKVGEVDLADSLIRVDLGRCNFSDGLDIKKRLGKAIPPPVFKVNKTPAITCLPIGTPTVTFVVDNTVMPPGLTYDWSYGGWKLIHRSTDGDSLVLEPGDNEQLIKLTVSGVDFCKPIDTTYTITRSLSASSTIEIEGGSACVPENTTLTFSVKGVSSGTALNWSIYPTEDNGWSIPAGQNTASRPDITIGTVDRSVIVFAGTCSNEADTLDITIKPNKPVFTTVDTCITKGSTSTVNYAINTVAHATGYSWTLPPGWSGSSSTTSITATPNGTNGGYVVAHALGCETNSDSVLVKFNPVKPGTITRNPSGCINRGLKDTITFSVVNEPGQTYEWKKPATWNFIGSTTGNSVVIETDGVAGNSYKVYVRAMNSCDTTAYDSLTVSIAGVGTINITVDDILDEFDVKIGESLTASFVSSPVSYQWYRNNVEISGANTRFLDLDVASTTAQFCVLVTKNGCATRSCVNSDFTTARMSTPTKIYTATELDKLVSAYPNPAGNEVNIALPKQFGSAKLMITDVSGNKIYSTSLQGSQNVVNTSKLIAGNYFLQIEVDGASVVKKLQIVR